jgi:prephenate dehydratase
VRVAHQGEPGAFSEEAVLRFFGDAVEPVAVPTWRAVFEAVREGRDGVGAGVVAIESSLAGSIRETYDLLLEYYDPGIRITGEVSVPVDLALVALPGEPIEAIERVYSHAQALAQADDFLRARQWTVMTTYNTAGAARMIAERRERGAAAIASPRVAAIYGLEVVAADIQTGSDNRTRFAVLGRAGRTAGRPPGQMKTTLVFAVRNVPGSLHRCLGTFATRGLNLSRLESRPSRTARWEYVFWVDLDADAAEGRAAEAVEALRTECEMVRVLGVYPAAADD